MAKINKEKQAAMPQKLLHELLEYDGLTGDWIWLVAPNRRIKVGQPAGCVNKVTGYVAIQINGHPYLAHRLAWVYVYGDYPDGEQPYIDHINGKRADNRIENLRASSHVENGRNKKINTDNTVGVTGICRAACWNGGKTKLNWYWIASWQNENGKKRSKRFNIEKLGEGAAKQAAIDYRAEQLRLLELNHGITYSERHGT